MYKYNSILSPAFEALIAGDLRMSVSRKWTSHQVNAGLLTDRTVQ